MPKLNPAVKKRRAKIIAKKLIRANGSVNALARAEGVSPPTISKKVNSPEVQHELMTLLASAGATDSKFARVISEGMDANEIEFKFRGRGKNARTLELKKPDHPVRLKAGELFAKLKGFLKDAGGGPSGLIIMLPGGYESIL